MTTVCDCTTLCQRTNEEAIVHICTFLLANELCTLKTKMGKSYPHYFMVQHDILGCMVTSSEECSAWLHFNTQAQLP